MNCSRSSTMSNSDRSRWTFTEETMIRVRINLEQHTQCSNMTSMTQQKTMDRAKPGTEHTRSSRSWRWHSAADPTPENNTQGLKEQMHSSNETTQRCPQRHDSPTSTAGLRSAGTTAGLRRVNTWHVSVKGKQQPQVCLLACEQLPVKWSHQHRHIVRSPSAQTFHYPWYKEWTEEDRTHFPVARPKRLWFTHW